jgi:hypothetical protein
LWTITLIFIAVGIHRERGHQVVTVGSIDQTFLEQSAVTGPNFTPEDSAPRVDRILGASAFTG